MIHIEPLRPADWITALELALVRVPPEQRAARVQHGRHLLETGVLDPGGIWVARQGKAIVGVQACAPLAGAACLFWLPTAPENCAAPLVKAGLDWARSIGCKLAHAVAGPVELEHARPLQQQGFRLITQLQQFGRSLADLPAIPAALRYECYRPALHAEFAATLERTYEDTLDCPELNGVRTIEEILAGHRGQGVFHPEFWWLAYDERTPVGVVMLIAMPDGCTWELAYLGVVPPYRRRGLGRAMTLHALHLLRDAQPATRVLVAVDERNRPARRLYQSLGFVELEWSHVLLYFFR